MQHRYFIMVLVFHTHCRIFLYSLLHTHTSTLLPVPVFRIRCRIFPVFTVPHSHVHEFAGTGAGFPHSIQNFPVFFGSTLTCPFCCRCCGCSIYRHLCSRRLLYLLLYLLLCVLTILRHLVKALHHIPH